MQITNRAGFKFIPVEGTDFVEVYHSKASFPNIPVEVVKLSETSTQSAINRLANESREYARFI